MPDLDAEGPSRFFNRELSWLSFNTRVLEEAENPHVPLLERLRFLSISATNLDEFYTVRVAGLRGLAQAGNTTPGTDGLSPAEQLVLINRDARALIERQQRVWCGLRAAMEEQGICLVDAGRLTEPDREHLSEHFAKAVFPVLSPLAIDPAHPFPFIPNSGFSLALQLERESDARPLRALLPIPAQVDRFIHLPSPSGQHRVLPLEALLLLRIGDLFPGYRVVGHCIFKVLRDSDLELEDEAEDLVREFETALKRRRRGEVVRLKLSAGAPPPLRALVMDELDVTEESTVEIAGLIGVSDLKELVLDGRPDLLWPSFTPRVPERVQDHEGDMFAAIRQKDMLLHHPYETFDMVVRFIDQAATDPDVVAIKQTLYRTSADSPIVGALCEAAEAGKSVTALVELKARFDEAANIRQSRKLERAGAHVTYGFVDYKTHAKIATVVRREAGGLRTYTHYGTGNYHPITARIYTDLSLFTCDPTLGRDATKVFNYLSGSAEPDHLDNLAISPLSLKARLIEMLGAEAEHAARGPARRRLGQDEQPHRPRRDRRALRGQPRGRADRPRDPRHLRAQARDRGVVRDDPRQIHRGPVPRAQPDRLLRRRARHALAGRARLHLFGRLDGAQPQPPGRDAGGVHEPHREGADRRPDHGRQHARRGPVLAAAARRRLRAPGGGRPGRLQLPSLLHGEPLALGPGLRRRGRRARPDALPREGPLARGGRRVTPRAP